MKERVTRMGVDSLLDERTGLKFTTYRISARKDILHFVEENLDPKIYKDLGNNPQRWIEELNTVSILLTGESLCAGIGLNLPPQEDPEFKKLGERIFLYRGKTQNLRGIWISEEINRYDFEKKTELPYTQWSHFRMGTFAELKLNTAFSDISPETFFPENFEPRSTVVKENKRPILTFEIKRNEKMITVFAKGAFVATSLMYNPPSYRLTNLSNVERTTSQVEMKRFLELAQQGIKVPQILGYYKAPIEEFLFVEKVEGGNPLDFLCSHRETIIEQDAQMLATLCLSGYKKIGFTDFDDKIFDGQFLYLIDVDELNDLYFPFSPDFRRILINPTQPKILEEFRRNQKSIMETFLKDTIYHYRESLTPTLSEQILYITSFFQKIGWGKPTKKQIREITTFPNDYITLDSSLSMMCEE